MSTGPTFWSLFPYSEKGPNETCPKNGSIYTQNMHVLTGKYKRLDSLVDPIVDLVIPRNIMVYWIQEKWVVVTGNKLVRGHMVFWHNQEGMFKDSNGRIPVGLSIMLSPAAVRAWKEAGSKYLITTPH